MTLAKDSSAFSGEITRKEIADYLYSQLIEKIVNVLENQEGLNFKNTLIDFGEQVACGESIYWGSYIKTISAIVKNYLDPLPEKFIWAMWQNIRNVYNIEYIDEDDDLDEIYVDLYEDITEEVLQRLYPIAESAYDDYEAELEDDFYDDVDNEDKNYDK